MNTHNVMEESTVAKNTLPGLPYEILMEIIDRLNEDEPHWPTILALKHLRLTCRRLAQLPHLLSIVFNSIQLVASPEHVELLKRPDLNITRFQPYVKKIVFRHDQYSWDVGLGRFREIINHQALLWLEKQNLEAPPGVDAGVQNLLERREALSELLEENPVFTEDELLEGFGLYSQKAHAVQLLMIVRRKELEEIWASVLGSFPTVDDFHISACRDNRNHPRESAKPRCELHEHSVEYWAYAQAVCVKQDLYLRSYTENGDCLFTIALRCLVVTNPRIRKLYLHHFTSPNLDWLELSDWRALNLVDLEVFNVGCYEAPTYGNMPWGKRILPNILEDVLGRSQNSLRTLQVTYRDSRIYPKSHWPSQIRVALPVLEYLELDNMHLHPIGLATFIRVAPKLMHLHLNECFVHDRGWNWKEVFTAIRYHPSRMLVQLDNVNIDQRYFSVYHHTSQGMAGDYDESMPDEFPHQSLCLYLSNRGQWNQNLQNWFLQ